MDKDFDKLQAFVVIMKEMQNDIDEKVTFNKYTQEQQASP